MSTREPATGKIATAEPATGERAKVNESVSDKPARSSPPPLHLWWAIVPPLASDTEIDAKLAPNSIAETLPLMIAQCPFRAASRTNDSSSASSATTNGVDPRGISGPPVRLDRIYVSPMRSAQQTWSVLSSHLANSTSTVPAPLVVVSSALRPFRTSRSAILIGETKRNLPILPETWDEFVERGRDFADSLFSDPEVTSILLVSHVSVLALWTSEPIREGEWYHHVIDRAGSTRKSS